MSKQDYIDHVVGSLPRWFVANERVMENISAFAEIFCRAEEQSEFFHQMTFIEQATEGPPDWLNQHAVDRSSLRQPGETNSALRTRIKGAPDTLTLDTLLQAVQGIVDDAGIIGTEAVLELRPNKAFFANNTAEADSFGVFSGTAPDMIFTPTVPSKTLPPRDGMTASVEIAFTGSASIGNDGTFVITGYDGDGITYTNAAGVPEVDGTVAWALVEKDVDGNVLEPRRRAYFSRGYRMGGSNALIVMLPFGCTSVTEAAVVETLRLIRGAGVKIIVECRQNP